MRRYIFSEKTAGIETLDFDVLIIGSGIAGLYAGLHIDPSKRTAIVSRRILHCAAPGWRRAASRQ